jgi:hypothetical protein
MLALLFISETRDIPLEDLDLAVSNEVAPGLSTAEAND